jgi:hypothetical protein
MKRTKVCETMWRRWQSMFHKNLRKKKHERMRETQAKQSLMRRLISLLSKRSEKMK